MKTDVIVDSEPRNILIRRNDSFVVMFDNII